KMGPISIRERRMLFIGVTTAILWIFRPVFIQWLPLKLDGLKDGSIAMLMAVMCFIIPARNEGGEHLLDSKVVSRVPWSVWLLFGGGLALASGIRTTGLDRIMGMQLTGAVAALPAFRAMQALAAAGIATVLTQVTSNLSSA